MNFPKLATFCCMVAIFGVHNGNTDCVLPGVKEDFDMGKLEGKWYTAGISVEKSGCRVYSQFNSKSSTTGTMEMNVYDFNHEPYNTVIHYDYKKVGKSRFELKSSTEKEFEPESVFVSDYKHYVMKLTCDLQSGEKNIVILVPNQESQPEQVAAATNALEDIGGGWELVKFHLTECKKLQHIENKCVLPDISERFEFGKMKGRWYTVGESTQLKGCVAYREFTSTSDGGTFDRDYFNLNDETQNTLMHYQFKRLGQAKFVKKSHLEDRPGLEFVMISDYENYAIKFTCDPHTGEKVAKIYAPNPESLPEQVATATNKLEEVNHGWELLKFHPTECKNLPNVHYDIHDIIAESASHHGHAKCTLPEVTNNFDFEKLVGTWYSAGETAEVHGCTVYKNIRGTNAGGKMQIEHVHFGASASPSQDLKEYKKVGNSRFTENQGNDGRESTDFVMVSDYKNYVMRLRCDGHTGKRVITIFVPSPESQPEHVAAATNQLEDIGHGWELLKFHPSECKRIISGGHGHGKTEL